MKIYTGAPAAARHYLEASRSRADDYYLAEGTGIGRRLTTSEGRVVEVASVTGDAYEVWVAGRNPETGESRGQLRTDDQAVRFVEVVVNGPKSWSLAAALHPDIATAYDAAQDRAAEQIIGWLSQHATTRVGPRGGQVQVPVERLEAVTVRHYTSRAGDPHRHLHLQLNARVFAEGKWRGLHTVGIRDNLTAINGIGHAAVTCDPQFRAALAAHGFTLSGTGEILQLADHVGPMSARAGQIARNLDRYEGEWTAEHPREHPGPALRRGWDARAWADGRPDKVAPQAGENLDERWRTELYGLGYRNPERPADLAPTPIGALDRDAAVEKVLARLAAGRSAWNPADIRGEVERLIASAGIVTEPAVRIELAEDLTARILDRCITLVERGGLPEHVRAWTSRPVLDTEAELTTRLAARAVAVSRDLGDVDWTLSDEAAARLDAGQAAAVAALSGQRRLVVVEGAAGAGKTTTLAAAREVLERSGRHLTVVTPTLKAAKVAAGQLRASAGSAAWLAHQHGWRWDDDGVWTRLAVGETDPRTGGIYPGPDDGARLATGDLLVVDEAGMLNQDTARALLTVADECQVRLALLGDRHQLAAVGRGGVLDLAVDQVDAAGHVTLDSVHRFTRADAAGHPVPDASYAELTLAMRTGDDPGAVFDALVARGQIRLHPDKGALHEAVAGLSAASRAAGEQVAVVVDTREQAAELSTAIREALVAAGRVHDARTVTGRAGQPIGAGDRVVTRRNDRDLEVANRDTWIVTAVGRRGGLLVTPANAATSDAPGRVTPGNAGLRVLPDDYVTAHVELAYATTAYGVQGETVSAAHVVIGEQTGAAGAYVGMTRGCQANTAHQVAADVAEAREQWISVFGRGRADLGPAHAARRAAADLARYAPGRPLEPVLADLHRAWTAEQRCRDQLAVQQLQRDVQRALGDQHPPESRLAALKEAERALAAGRQELTDVRAELARLAREPDLLAQAADRLARERSAWRARQSAEHDPAPSRRGPGQGLSRPRPEDLRLLASQRIAARGIPR